MAHCWTNCSTGQGTPPPGPLARSSSEATNVSAVSSVSSVKTVLHALHKVVNHKGDLGEDEFDIGEDLEKSLDMFQGMIKAKDDEIEILNTKVLELKKELEFREEKDKDFEVLQKIAEDEVLIIFNNELNHYNYDYDDMIFFRQIQYLVLRKRT